MKMADIPWQLINQTLKSRLFLLCIILVPGVFLYNHYVTLPGTIVLSHERVVFTGSKIVNNDTPTKLISDYFVPLDHVIQKVVPESNNSAGVLDVSNVSRLDPNVSRSASKSCTKKFDVSFLKVHKAGSTTVMNIFLRFAISHNLNIVLPSKADGFGFNYLGYGRTVTNESIVPLPANETYNILCNHVVYNKDAFRSILPADTEYVGILREPASHFVSAASYYGFYKSLVRTIGESGSVSAATLYLQDPAKYRIANGFVNNRMSFDFGVPRGKFYDEQYVMDYISVLDQDYRLVMIMERFHESLVLLKRMLCWETKDILYVPLNARKSGPEFRLNENDVRLLKRYNGADFKLYDHFRAKFDAEVESLGEDFQSELKSFISIQESVSTFCQQTASIPDTPGGPTMTVPETHWGESFAVTIGDCKLMTESELPMMHRLINAAWDKYNQSLKKS